MRHSNTTAWYLSLLLIFAVYLSSCEDRNVPQPIGADSTNNSNTPSVPTSNSIHLTLGNPSNAVKDESRNTNYLLEKDEYVLSYNQNKATANWVAWHLDNSWLGSAARQDDFRPDNALPSAWFKVATANYSNTGFDRGHLCPSADRTKSVAANSNTFLMTNIIPQAPKNNQGPWANLEDYCRTLVSQGNELYIYAGVEGQGGSGSNGGTTNTINNNTITVPAYTWKVIIILPTGDNDLSRINTQTRIIAVRMPNTQSIESDWGKYRVSVDELERLLSYDFLSKVSTEVQNILESKIDTGATK